MYYLLVCWISNLCHQVVKPILIPSAIQSQLKRRSATTFNKTNIKIRKCFGDCNLNMCFLKRKPIIKMFNVHHCMGQNSTFCTTLFVFLRTILSHSRIIVEHFNTLTPSCSPNDSWMRSVMPIWDVLKFHSQNQKPPLVWPGLGMYPYFLPLFYMLYTRGKKLPISPDTRMGWEFTYGHKILFSFKQ